jgi:hypothetical protein
MGTSEATAEDGIVIASFDLAIFSYGEDVALLSIDRLRDLCRRPNAEDSTNVSDEGREFSFPLTTDDEFASWFDNLTDERHTSISTVNSRRCANKNSVSYHEDSQWNEVRPHCNMKYVLVLYTLELHSIL